MDRWYGGRRRGGGGDRRGRRGGSAAEDLGRQRDLVGVAGAADVRQQAVADGRRDVEPAAALWRGQPAADEPGGPVELLVRQPRPAEGGDQDVVAERLEQRRR